jgi:hypothetical protein
MYINGNLFNFLAGSLRYTKIYFLAGVGEAKFRSFYSNFALIFLLGKIEEEENFQPHKVSTK